ncbi:MAG: DNA cytosine methyltransferase [Candidatus Delongbacteria bacterium]|nr:DNA cytosine methyltransferase [Candidatus Delongbacteria bacterium]
MKEYSYIDIFSGCGGLSVGLMNSGWKGIFAIEKSKEAFETLKYNLINNKKHFNWPNWLPIQNYCIDNVIKRYKNELEELKGKVDLIVGGPPCQGFSTAGKRNREDERNNLVNSYIKFIKIVKPSMLFFENVKGFTLCFKKKNGGIKHYSNYVCDKLSSLGYSVHGEILDFSDFGIPQRRKRFILIGLLTGDPKKFFETLEESKAKFLKSKGLKNKQNLKAAISDLLKKNGIVDSPDTKYFKAGKYGNPTSNYQILMRKTCNGLNKIPDSHRFANHSITTIKKFKYIIKNAPRNIELKDFISKICNTKKRTVVLLDKNTVAPTLTTLPDDCIHYCEPRILTVREYARIQSFPDWFEFKAKYTTGNNARKRETPRYSQVGNAIPPLFSEQCGLIFKEVLDGN